MSCQLVSAIDYIISKDQEGKDRRRQLLYYVSLIRACNKVLYQLVYIVKKFVFLKEPLYLINPVGPKNVKKWFVYYVVSRFC